MIDPIMLTSMRDEMNRIYSDQIKIANMSGAQTQSAPTNANQIPTQAATPPAALNTMKVKSPPKGGSLSGIKPTYSKVNTTPTSSPAIGQQNLASPPPVRA